MHYSLVTSFDLIIGKGTLPKAVEVLALQSRVDPVSGKRGSVDHGLQFESVLESHMLLTAFNCSLTRLFVT